MKRLYLPLILFLFLVLEGVALDLLPGRLLTGDLLIVPHWVLIFLVFITIFYENERTYYSFIYALVFGLLIDVVYTGILGVYMFSYAFAIYIVHLLNKLVHANIHVSILLGVVAVVLSDISINVIYLVAGVNDMIWQDYFMTRLLPTLISNLVFLVILYPLFVKRLTTWGQEQLSGNNTL
ncbi:rod shape-determining protein MreD [Oceanobacillus manasiensis]|uniref:rod shape-determining protein MreD n=1 Tax=Oceanobacillus manasiensis TaxID=586413 RepID=UPI0005A83B08|nr:rod shape-determining protein MreD [Oceanobacillus manasiensis]